MTSEKFTIAGREYESFEEFADAYNITTEEVKYIAREKINLEDFVASRKEAGSNSPAKYFINGEGFKSKKAIAEAYNMNYNKLLYRINNLGMTPEEAVTM